MNKKSLLLSAILLGALLTPQETKPSSFSLAFAGLSFAGSSVYMAFCPIRKNTAARKIVRYQDEIKSYSVSIYTKNTSDSRYEFKKIKTFQDSNPYLLLNEIKQYLLEYTQKPNDTLNIIPSITLVSGKTHSIRNLKIKKVSIGYIMDQLEKKLLVHHGNFTYKKNMLFNVLLAVPAAIMSGYSYSLQFGSGYLLMIWYKVFFFK